MALSYVKAVLSGSCFTCILMGVAVQFAGVASAAAPARTNTADDFVQVIADIEILEWGAGLGQEEGPRPRSFEISAVVGRDKWVITNSDYGAVYSFDGGRIGARHQFQSPSAPGSASPPPPKQWQTTEVQSSDGNSGQEFSLSDGRKGVRDQLDMVSRIMWLGFCSARTLNNPNHKLYPPWEFWVEYLSPSSLSEKVTRFEDDLGLPRNVFIFSGGNQMVVDYRQTSATNIAGWTFPLGFYLLEYNPGGDKTWMLKMLAHCKVSSISRVPDPFPAVARPVARVPGSGTRRFGAVAPSKMHIEGTSDVHDWFLENTNVVGFLDLTGPPFSPNSSAHAGANSESQHLQADGEFFFPVRYFSSGDSAPMFSDEADQAVLHRALQTTDYPNVVYRLRKLTPAAVEVHEPSVLLMQSTGEVVIGAVTNVVSMPIRVVREDKGLTLSGSASVHLSDFGIQAPAAQGKGWVVKVGDTIQSTFELRLREVE